MRTLTGTELEAAPAGLMTPATSPVGLDNSSAQRGSIDDSSAQRGAIDAQLERMEPIGLDELNAQARLMTRVDRKYFVPRQLFIQLLQGHRG